MIVTKSSVRSVLTTSSNKDFDYGNCLLSCISYAFFQGFFIPSFDSFILVSDCLVFYYQLKDDAVYSCFLFSII